MKPTFVRNANSICISRATAMLVAVAVSGCAALVPPGGTELPDVAGPIGVTRLRESPTSQPGGGVESQLSQEPVRLNDRPSESAPAIREAGFDAGVVRVSAPIPRVQLADAARQTELPPPEAIVPSYDAADYPDEYLFDGGDRDHPVHYSERHREGLDTEDTVVEYTDHLGKTHVKPSNRVAVYAPRFGAVRTITGPRMDQSVDRVASTHRNLTGGRMRTRQTPLRHARTDQAGGIRVRSRASGLERTDRLNGVRALSSLALAMKKYDARQTIKFVAGREFDQADEAWLANSIRNAVTWSKDEFPQITATLMGTGEVYATFRAAEHVSVEDRRKTRGNLVITKLADKETAQPGEVVTFTIRFENIGDFSLHDIRIVDNLTPRLEFIPDSAAADRPGDVSFEENGEGSLVLTFRLDDPIPGAKEEGSSTGVISFQARVR